MNIDNNPCNTDLFCCFSAHIEKTYKLAPLTSKLQAYMILESNEEGVTFEELLDVFNVSKSSLSNSINFLLSTNQIEYINKIDSRKRYFRMNANYLKEKLDFVHEMISQDIIYTNKINEYKMQNNSFPKNFNMDILNVYLNHLNETKKILSETIETINQIQLENK